MKHPKILIFSLLVGLLVPAGVYFFSHYQINYVKGFSMVPTFNENDILISKKAKLQDIGLFDIINFYPITWNFARIFFEYPLPLITHRVVGIELINGTIWYNTSGDFYTIFNMPDPQVPCFSAIGKVILVIQFKYILYVIGSILVSFIIIFIFEQYKKSEEKKL